VFLMRSCMSAIPHRVTSHKTVILIVTSVVAFSVNSISISVLFLYFLRIAIVNGLSRSTISH